MVWSDTESNLEKPDEVSEEVKETKTEGDLTEFTELKQITQKMGNIK